MARVESSRSAVSGPSEPSETPAARLLLVESDEYLRRLLTAMLDPHFELLVAEDAAAGLGLARASKPDLVLTGVLMPGQDGLELLAALRADPATAATPVLVLSTGSGGRRTTDAAVAEARSPLLESLSSPVLLTRVRESLSAAAANLRNGAWRARLLDAISDGFFVMQADGAVVGVNQAFAEILGYGPEELPYPAPHPWWPGPDTEDGATLRRICAESRFSGQTRMSARLLHRDGRTVHVEASLAVVPRTEPDAGEGLLVGVLRDVTARHHATRRAERTAARERRLYEVSTRLAAATTVTDAAGALAGAMAEAFGAEGVVVFTVHPDEPGRLHLEHAIGFTAPVVEAHARVDVGADFIPSAVVRSGRPLWLTVDPDVLRAHPYLGELESGREPRAAAALPLIAGTRAVGAVGLDFTTERAFSDEERAFAATLVAQAAQAFDRAASADARWRVAQILQRALLPSVPPTVERLAVATRYLPAVHDVAAGGDWYDLIRLDHDRTALVVGDVVGQGAPAATVMGQLRSVLAARLHRGEPPARALADLDHYAATVPGALASTAACVVIDTAAMTLRWSCAGHPAPLLVRPDDPDRPVRYLDGGRGPLLGCLAESPPPGSPGDVPRYAEGELPLRTGDTVLLYTDGLVERRAEVIDVGFDRLAAAATGIGNVPPQELVDGLLSANELDGVNHDDVAVIAARVLPEPLRLRLPARAESLRGLRREVARWSAAAGLSDTHAYDLQLALGEAATNAVEHAYPEDAPDPTFECDLVYQHGLGVEVTVRDHGTWRAPPSNPGHRGRGLRLIGAVAPDLRVERTPDGTDGTRVTFTVGAAEPGRDPAVSAPGLPALHELGRTASLRVLASEPPVLELSGDLNLAGLPAVRTEVLAHIAGAPGPRVVLDVRDVRFVSSAGMALLMELADRAYLHGVHLEVRHQVGAPVARIFQLTGPDLHPAVTLTEHP